MASEDEDHGCAYMIGLVAVSLSVGVLTNDAWGWMTFGVGMIFAALWNSTWASIARRKNTQEESNGN